MVLKCLVSSGNLIEIGQSERKLWPEIGLIFCCIFTIAKQNSALFCFVYSLRGNKEKRV